MARKELELVDLIRYESGSTNIPTVIALARAENNLTAVIVERESVLQVGSKELVIGNLRSLFAEKNININVPASIWAKYEKNYVDEKIG